MKRTWTIIGVRDVPGSFKWYQSLFGQPGTSPSHDYFGQILDTDGTVLLCLHQWGAHEHPSLTSPNEASPGNGLLLFFRVDDYDEALKRARSLVARFEEEPHLNPNTQTMEFSLRDPDGYYVTISALSGDKPGQRRGARANWGSHGSFAVLAHVGACFSLAGLVLDRRLNETKLMVEIVYYVASSLDGYIATLDGSVDWLSRFHRRGEDHGAADLEASVDALLLGSHTYEFALKLGRWPSPDKPSWVFTHRKLALLDPSITLTAETPAEVVRALEKRGCRRAWLMGGGKLAASFHAEQLISRYILSVFPVLLGKGIPAFAPHLSTVSALRLVAAKPFKSGIVQLTYEATNAPNDPVATGGGL